MKGRSRAGGNPAKARPSKSLKLKRHIAHTAAAGGISARQEIADWLKNLGMSEYARRFAVNDIDFTILGDLTDQDLEKIGVKSLGHRRKLLRAIADLGEGGKATQKTAALVEYGSEKSARGHGWRSRGKISPNSRAAI